MIINKIELKEEDRVIVVWTDAVKDRGFIFKIDDITDKADLKVKVKASIQQFLSNQHAKDMGTKYQDLKTLEGSIN